MFEKIRKNILTGRLEGYLEGGYRTVQPRCSSIRLTIVGKDCETKVEVMNEKSDVKKCIGVLPSGRIVQIIYGENDQELYSSSTWKRIG